MKNGRLTVVACGFKPSHLTLDEGCTSSVKTLMILRFYSPYSYLLRLLLLFRFRLFMNHRLLLQCPGLRKSCW